MSVSKTGKLFVTDEEIASAKENANALDYVRMRGYALKGTNGRYELADDHTIVFKDTGKDRGRVYFNREAKSGDALTFMMEYEGMSFVDAVLTLSNPNLAQDMQRVREQVKPEEKEPFRLPKAAENSNILCNYLIQHRCCDPEIVQRLLSEGRIYQSSYYNSVVMVGYDETGIARSASIRSTEEVTGKGEKYNGDKTSSDKTYSFVIHGDPNTNTLVAVESPIEAMSYWSIAKQFGSPALKYDILALGGAGVTMGLEHYLQHHPNIQKLIIALNNDSQKFDHKINTGELNTEKLFRKFGQSYAIQVHTPQLNDWNDTIKAIMKNKALLDQMQGRNVSEHRQTKTINR